MTDSMVLLLHYPTTSHIREPVKNKASQPVSLVINIISIYLPSILFSIPEGLNRIMAFFNKSNIYKDSIGVCMYPMYI